MVTSSGNHSHLVRVSGAMAHANPVKNTLGQYSAASEMREGNYGQLLILLERQALNKHFRSE